MKNCIALAISASAFACSAPSPVYIPVSPQAVAGVVGTLSVDAMGRVEVAPDFATVQVSFTREKASEVAARAALHEAVVQLSGVLKTLDIQGTDLSFSQAGVRPVSGWNAARTAQETVGYEAFKTSSIVIRDLGRLKDVLNAILKASGTLGDVSDISLGVEDPSDFEAKARAIALEKANAKAVQLADGTSSNLGGIQTLSESILRPMSQLSKEVLFARINSGYEANSGAKLFVAVTVQMTYGLRP